MATHIIRWKNLEELAIKVEADNRRDAFYKALAGEGKIHCVTFGTWPKNDTPDTKAEPKQ